MEERTFRDSLAEHLGEKVADELIKRLESSPERRPSIEELEENLVKALDEYLAEIRVDEVMAAPAVGAAAKPTATGVGSGVKTGIGTGVGVRIGTK